MHLLKPIMLVNISNDQNLINASKTKCMLFIGWIWSLRVSDWYGGDIQPRPFSCAGLPKGVGPGAASIRREFCERGIYRDRRAFLSQITNTTTRAGINNHILK